MTLVLGLLGLAMLAAGGEAFLRGSVALAARLGVSQLVIGLTLVAFGTSAPELVTSVEAALAAAPGIAVGNVVGSNICNILLVLGLAAALRPISTDPEAFRRDGAMLVLATALGAGAILSGEIGRAAGLVGVAVLALYVWSTWRAERADGSTSARLHRNEAGATDVPGLGLPAAAALAVLGLGILVAGSGLAVDAAVALAQALAVGEEIIGLTIVAIGTSLPELVTSVMAALRGRADLALGNVIGSSIFNLLGILGLTALVSPLPIPDEIAAFDLWVMIGATLGGIAFAVTGGRMSRAEGLFMLGLYGAYLAALVLRA